MIKSHEWDPTKVLHLESIDSFLEENDLEAESEPLRGANMSADLFGKRARKGMAFEILRKNRIFDKFVSVYWPYGATPEGKRKIERADRCYQEWLEQQDPEVALEDQVTEKEQLQMVEKELQIYLAKNPALLEPGMTLWEFADGQSPIEVRVDERGRGLDILAKDIDGNPVVIELKARRGHEHVVGQALYYQECMKQKLNVPRVRTFIIASEISPEIRNA